MAGALRAAPDLGLPPQQPEVITDAENLEQEARLAARSMESARADRRLKVLAGLLDVVTDEDTIVDDERRDSLLRQLAELIDAELDGQPGSSP